MRLIFYAQGSMNVLKGDEKMNPKSVSLNQRSVIPNFGGKGWTR